MKKFPVHIHITTNKNNSFFVCKPDRAAATFSQSHGMKKLPEAVYPRQYIAY